MTIPVLLLQFGLHAVQPMRIAVQRWRLTVVIAGLLLSGFARPVIAVDVLWSVERLNASKPDWPQLTGARLRIEGRLATRLKGQIRLSGCPLSFHVQPEHEAQIGSSKNLEVTGTLALNDGMLYFNVSSLKPLPTDMEQLRSRELALKNAPASDWYELAQWARERANFYKDQELAEAALTSLTRGIGLELSRLPDEDFEARFAIAEKARQLQAPELYVDDLRHEAFRIWWLSASSANRSSPEQLLTLEARLKKEWPEALIPGSPFPSDLVRLYTDHPSETYRQADPARRQVLRRIFGADVQIKRLQKELAADGRNGMKLAEELEQLVPERKALAIGFRNAELTYRLRQVATSSKAEVQQLAELLTQENRTNEAQDALQRWMVAREQRLRPETAPEFVALADDYLNLLQDQKRAVALLTEAFRREPESEDVRNRFAALGYVFNGVTWVKSNPLPTSTPLPDSPMTEAPSLLSVGMTIPQLKQMLGEPTSRSRLATRGRLHDYWVYGRESEGSRLVIELAPGESDAERRVTRFYQR